MLMLVWCAGCAGDLRDPERFQPLLFKDGGPSGGNSATGGSSSPNKPDHTPPECVDKVFEAKCAMSGCHTRNSIPLDLVSDGVGDRLVDQNSYATGICKGKTLLSTEGKDSLMLQKLEDDPPCGSKMPLVGTLNDDESKCLTDWLESVTGKK